MRVIIFTKEVQYNINSSQLGFSQKNAKDTLVRRLVKKFRKSLLEKDANLTINPLNNLEYGDIALQTNKIKRRAFSAYHYTLIFKLYKNII